MGAGGTERAVAGGTKRTVKAYGTERAVAGGTERAVRASCTERAVRDYGTERAVVVIEKRRVQLFPKLHLLFQHLVFVVWGLRLRVCGWGVRFVRSWG